MHQCFQALLCQEEQTRTETNHHLWQWSGPARCHQGSYTLEKNMVQNGKKLMCKTVRHCRNVGQFLRKPHSGWSWTFLETNLQNLNIFWRKNSKYWNLYSFFSQLFLISHQLKHQFISIPSDSILHHFVLLPIICPFNELLACFFVCLILIHCAVKCLTWYLNLH